MQRILVVLLALAVAGCTDDAPEENGDPDTDPGGSGGAGPQNGTDEPRQNVEITITWSGVYNVNGAYDKPTVSVPANSTVTLTFVNDEGNPVIDHDLVVENIEEASTDVISPGEDDEVTFDVGAPMETKFFCSVGNHRQNGMEGTFIIE